MREYEMPMEEQIKLLVKKIDSLERKFDEKFGAMDQKFDLQGLRESMDDKFKAAAKTSSGHTDMLQSVLIHVRKRVEVLERPKRRS